MADGVLGGGAGEAGAMVVAVVGGVTATAGDAGGAGGADTAEVLLAVGAAVGVGAAEAPGVGAFAAARRRSAVSAFEGRVVVVVAARRAAGRAAAAVGAGRDERAAVGRPRRAVADVDFDFDFDVDVDVERRWALATAGVGTWRGVAAAVVVELDGQAGINRGSSPGSSVVVGSGAGASAVVVVAATSAAAPRSDACPDTRPATKSRSAERNKPAPRPTRCAIDRRISSSPSLASPSTRVAVPRGGDEHVAEREVRFAVPSVLITGASRGIGRATALHLASLGWETYAGVRKAADGDELADAAGGRVRPVVLDITDAGQVAALDATLPSTLDALVNNAGIVVGGPIEAVPLDEVRRQLEVNVVGQIAVTQALLPRLRWSKGRVVFVSSLSGRVSTPMTGAYSASKYALEAVADALRLELRPWRIGVVLVEPAQTDTDMWRTADDLLEEVVGDLDPDMRSLYAGHIEGQRVAIPKARKMAAPVEGAAETIERALTARRPRARYVVGTGPRVMAAVVPFLPTRLRDVALAASGGVPRRA